jgi:arylsulfatase A-like enzyme
VLVQPLYGSLVSSNSFDRRDASEVNRDIVRWFGTRSKRLFFLFVNYFDAHYPYDAPRPYDHRFGKVPQAAIRRAADSGFRGHVPEPLLEDRSALVTAYDNCLAYLDDQVGQLVRFLARSPEWANTVVIITSDHGEAFGEHRVYGHGMNLYREVLHVPLIFLGPGIPAGRRVAHVAPLREIFQTVIDLVSGPNPIFDRTSLRRFWRPSLKIRPSDDVAISELVSSISVTTPEWHYIYSGNGRSELYHWTTDPQERIDLSEHLEGQRTLHVPRVALSHDIGIIDRALARAGLFCRNDANGISVFAQ